MASVMPQGAGEETFQSRLNQNEPFEQVQLLALILAMAEELGTAHRAGRYHGAITPADIRFDTAGEIRLGGWGRDTTPGSMPTSAYSAIECYAPVHPQGPWTDVYALAAILWRAITGGPPTTALKRMGNVTLAQMAPSRFDAAFLKAVDAALEVAPQRRPRDIDAWVTLLSGRPAPAAATTSPVVAAPPVVAAAPVAAAKPGAANGATARADAVPVAKRRAPFGSLALGVGFVAAIAGGIYLANPSDPEPWSARPTPKPVVTAARRPVPGAVAAPTTAAPQTIVIEAPTPDSLPSPVQVAAVPEPTRTDASPSTAAPARVQPAVTGVPTSSPAPLPPSRRPPAAPPLAEPPIELLARADDHLRDLYDDFDGLSRRLRRSYRDDDLPYATKQQAYRESRRIQAELVELRSDRNRISTADSAEDASRRFAALAETATQLRDRMVMVRRSL